MIKNILTMDPKERRKGTIKKLSKQFKQNKFLAEMEQTADADSMFQLYQKLGYTAHRAGEAVFHYGDKGDLFYIILEGKVEVRTVSPVELDGESTTPEGLITFIISYWKDIYWAKISDSYTIKDMFMNELQRLKVPVDLDSNFDE